MEEKLTAIYLMARLEELKPEDGGNYDRALAAQKEECLRVFREKAATGPDEKPEIYTSRGQLLIDVERDKIKKLIVFDLDRLGTGKDEIEGILYELKMREVQVLTVK